MDLLQGNRGVVFHIIQPDLAVSHDLGMATQPAQLCVITLSKLRDIMGMHPHRGIDAFMLFSQPDGPARAFQINAHSDDPGDSSRHGPSQHRLTICLIGRHIKVAMGIDQNCPLPGNRQDNLCFLGSLFHESLHGRSF